MNDLPDNETCYDVCVVGTGYYESVAAAACALRGLKVLHLDSTSYYGSSWSSFSVQGLRQWAQLHSPSITTAAVPTAAVQHEEDGDGSITSTETDSVPGVFSEANISTALARAVVIDSVCDLDNVPNPTYTSRRICFYPLIEDSTTREESDITTNTTTAGTAATGATHVACDTSATTTVRNDSPDETQIVTESNASSVYERTVQVQSDSPLPTGASESKLVKGCSGSTPATEIVVGGVENRATTERQHNLEKQPSRFSLDLQPRVMMSRGGSVDLLIKSGVSRYLEYRAVPLVALLIEPPEGSHPKIALHLVTLPHSKSAVFTSKTLKAQEKRLLMAFFAKYVKSAAVSAAFSSPAKMQFDNYDKALILAASSAAAAAAIQDDSGDHVRNDNTSLDNNSRVGNGIVNGGMSWAELLNEGKLTDFLKVALTYGLCLADVRHSLDGTYHRKTTSGTTGCAATGSGSAVPGDSAQSSGCVWTADKGLRRMGHFVASVGQYHPTGSLLYPMYGFGDVSQAFSRLCALYRGTYMLRTGITKLCFLTPNDELELFGEFNVKVCGADTKDASDTSTANDSTGESNTAKDNATASSIAKDATAERSTANDTTSESSVKYSTGENSTAEGGNVESSVKAGISDLQSSSVYVPERNRTVLPCVSSCTPSEMPDKPRLAAAVLSTGRLVRFKKLVLSRGPLQQFTTACDAAKLALLGIDRSTSFSNTTSTVLRIVFIARQPVLRSRECAVQEGARLAVVPPSSLLKNVHPIQILQLDEYSCCTPPGHFVLHFASISGETEDKVLVDPPQDEQQYDKTSAGSRTIRTVEADLGSQTSVRLLKLLKALAPIDVVFLPLLTAFAYLTVYSSLADEDICMACAFKQADGTVPVLNSSQIVSCPDPPLEPLLQIPEPDEVLEVVRRIFKFSEDTGAAPVEVSLESLVPQPEHVLKDKNAETERREAEALDLFVDLEKAGAEALHKNGAEQQNANAALNPK
eukprot:Lankesteria_metandrocarpae@DN2133_c0_g1_i1.p1